MTLPQNKTRIVCTIGPSSDSPQVLKEMIRAGMDVARLNFSHGVFEDHKRVIENIRAASAETGRRVAILADLPGPKIRIGRLTSEPIVLKPGALFTLTTQECMGIHSYYPRVHGRRASRLCRFRQIARGCEAGRHPFSE